MFNLLTPTKSYISHYLTYILTHYPDQYHCAAKSAPQNHDISPLPGHQMPWYQCEKNSPTRPAYTRKLRPSSLKKIKISSCHPLNSPNQSEQHVRDH